MTAPLNAPAGSIKDAASARKRRRRAPAGGAADDCFTCSKRSVKCDRRRPYCSQCLEIGNECSGYKTQLTWGVGVASRGKLRGLSLPIAKAPPVNCVKKSPTRLRAGSNATTTQWNDQEERATREEIVSPVVHPPQAPPTPFPGYDVSHISSPEHAPPMSPATWDPIHFSNTLSTADGHRYQTSSMHLSVPGTGEMLPPSIESMSDVDYMSPLAHTFSREEMPYLHSPALMYDSFHHSHGSPVPQSPATAIMIEPQRAPTSCPSLAYGTSETGSSLQSHVDNYETQLSHKLMQECDSLVPGASDIDIYSSSTQSHNTFWPASIPEEEPAAQSLPKHSPTAWPSVYPAQTLSVSPDLISRMPFFMDYYENTMCPSMVLMDWSDNPFRDHILQLATGSRSLQHAICALAACNLRMKRRLSLGQHGRELGDKRLDAAMSESMSDTPPEDQSLSEEYQHRNLAIRLLNDQLSDNEKSRHDSVLATILLLCHYRMAESGIAKFHTQFAGVKKILSLRRSSPFPPSRESAWMEAIFTYFDALTASINDREAQLSPSFYGIVPDAQLLPPGAENLVGCDQELFKTIFKLGRLNLLSQYRPVQNLLTNSMTRGAPSRSQSPLDAPLGHAFKPNHAQHPSHLGPDPHSFPHHPPRFDGNGFGTTLDDDELFSAAPIHSPTTFDDHRGTFWREWKEARTALQGWEFDSHRVVAGLSPGTSTSSAAIPTGASGPSPSQSHRPPTPSQIRDLNSLSEAFRYAALLYTERLANANVPSSDSSFRNLVSQVVYYATSLESGSRAEKFLLWPLFVAGSECVNELQQNIVRSKCREIMARSGYMNNLAALEILERVWAGDAKDDGSGPKMAGMMKRGPFNWAKHIGGPGTDLEWIMF